MSKSELDSSRQDTTTLSGYFTYDRALAWNGPQPIRSSVLGAKLTNTRREGEGYTADYIIYMPDTGNPSVNENSDEHWGIRGKERTITWVLPLEKAWELPRTHTEMTEGAFNYLVGATQYSVDTQDTHIIPRLHQAEPLPQEEFQGRFLNAA